jgi:hypothetical protein
MPRVRGGHFSGALPPATDQGQNTHENEKSKTHIFYLSAQRIINDRNPQTARAS